MREYRVGFGINVTMSGRQSVRGWELASCVNGRSGHVWELDIGLVGRRAGVECRQSTKRFIDQCRVNRISELDGDGCKFWDVADGWNTGRLFIV
jgi:hypothetical protein